MTTTAHTTATEPAQYDEVMDLLEEHVPLTLLMDLSGPTGPDSQDILRTEGRPVSTWWVAR